MWGEINSPHILHRNLLYQETSSPETNMGR